MHYIAFLLLVLNALDIVTLSTAHPPSKQQLEMSTNTITAPPTLPSELLKRQDEDFEITCGCIIGVDDQGQTLGYEFVQCLTCSVGLCGYVSMQGSEELKAGCYGGGTYDFQATCIDGDDGQEDDNAAALVCAGSSSYCMTYTWRDYTAVSYACGTSRATITVEPYDGTMNPNDSHGGADLPTTEYSEPGTTANSAPESTKTGDSNGGGPGLGQETDLADTQRIAAIVSSAVAGFLMLGFFMIFGCCLYPGKREGELTNTVSETVHTSRLMVPGHGSDISYHGAGAASPLMGHVDYSVRDGL